MRMNCGTGAAPGARSPTHPRPVIKDCMWSMCCRPTAAAISTFWWAGAWPVFLGILIDMSAPLEVTRLTELGALLGESPVWDDVQKQLYWIDIESRTLHRCAADGVGPQSWLFDGKISCACLRCEQPGFIAGLDT